MITQATCVWGVNVDAKLILSHCAGVNCEGTLDELELQYSGLQEGLRRWDHVLLLLLFCSSPLLFVWENPEMVSFCTPALKDRKLNTDFKMFHTLFLDLKLLLTIELILIGSFFVPSERYLRAQKQKSKIFKLNEARTSSWCDFSCPPTQSPLRECRWGELRIHSKATSRRTPT